MDRHTGFVRFGFRDYDPQVGRFTAKDPIGYTGGDHDLYDYCVDDPVSFVDPEGLKEKAVEKATVGFWKSYAPFFHAHKDESIREGIIREIQGSQTKEETLNASRNENEARAKSKLQQEESNKAFIYAMRNKLEYWGKNMLGGHLIVIDDRTHGLSNTIIEQKNKNTTIRTSPKK